MYSYRNHAISGITKIIRTHAIRIACVMLTSGSISMAGSAAQAADFGNTPPHKVVNFKDLNLNTSEGAAVLYARIQSAAYEVCGSPDRYDLSELKLQTCVKAAVSEAISHVDRPMLTNLYEAKTGQVDKRTTTLAQAR
jgi:UrcA family protein